MTRPACFIKFKNGDFSDLRRELLKDLSKEHFAVLLGKTEILQDGTVSINVIGMRFLDMEGYISHSLTHVSINRDFVAEALSEIEERFDVDTMIDVHTHPFSEHSVHFSGVDDNDEKEFLYYLDKNFKEINYASIVLSRREYSARLWKVKNKKAVHIPAFIKTQTPPENIPGSDFRNGTALSVDEKIYNKDSFLNRSFLALGLDTMREITKDKAVTIVGVGGLGSIIAENLIHMGFPSINLIDNDTVEASNLNRIVGAYHSDTRTPTPKVDAIKRHLQNINPEAKIQAYMNDIHEPETEDVVAMSDWVFVATDNNASRYRTQELCLKYFVPMISAGVNITVEDGSITDMSGEVITVRAGDNLCLNCLGRINQTLMHYDLVADEGIRDTLVRRGYVTGKEIKEPAVKTLNSFVSNIATEVLINQHTMRQRHKAIIVFENNGAMCISEDTQSITHRNLRCMYCNI